MTVTPAKGLCAGLTQPVDLRLAVTSKAVKETVVTVVVTRGKPG